MKRFASGLLGGGAALVLAASSAGPALAATSVKSAIRAQDRVISHSPAVRKLHDFKANTPAQARPLIPAARSVAAAADHAADVVARASAPTARERRARRYWVAGVRKEADAMRILEASFKDVVRHDVGAARRGAARFTATLVAGDRLTARGDRLLGLPSRD